MIGSDSRESARSWSNTDSQNAQWDVSTNGVPAVPPFIPDSSFRVQRYVRQRQRHGLALQTSLRRHRDERRLQLGEQDGEIPR